MPSTNFIAPGIYVREFDFSDYVQAISATTLAVIGGASKGPLNTPTLVTNESALIRAFGKPLHTLNANGTPVDAGLYAAIQFFRNGGRNLLFTRVANNATSASYPIPGFAASAVLTAATGSIILAANPADGDTITIPSGTPVLNLSNTSYATGNVAITRSGGNIAVTGMAGGNATTNASGTITLSGVPSDGDNVVISDGATSKTFEFDTIGAAASGSVVFSANPTAGDNLVIKGDGTNPAITFQFGTGVSTPTLKYVAISTAVSDTIASLVVAINSVTSDTFTVYASQASSTTINIINGLTGAAGNQTITKVDSGTVMTVTGMTGGVAGSTVVAGAVAIPIVSGNAYQTAVNLSRAINSYVFNVVSSIPVTQTTFEFDNNAAVNPGNTPIPIIASNVLQTLSNLQNAIASASPLGVSVVNTTSGSTPSLSLIRNTGGAAYNGTILKTGSNITVTGFTGGTDASYGAIQTCLTVTALEPGSWGNSVYVVTQPTVIIGAPSNNFDILVYIAAADGSGLGLVERFTNLTFNSTSSRYVTKALVQGISGEFSPSQYISAAVSASAGLIAPGMYNLGSGTGQVGTDGSAGLTAQNYIGTVTGNVATGLQALRDPKTTEYSLLAIPGISHRDVISAAQSLIEHRGDAMYIVDTPFGLNVNTVIDWHNGKAVGVANAPVAPINSSYLAIYWSWCQANDDYSGNVVWLPPSGFIAGAMAASDNQFGGPFRAAAGPVRGLLKISDIEYNPSDDEIALLEGVQNRVNPLVYFPNTGVEIYGDITSQRRLSALGSVKTRRAVMFGEKACATAVRVLQWDPNDAVTWRAFTQLCNAELAKIVAARGLAAMKVVCDESTNPPEQRQQKTLRGQLFVQENPDAAIIVLDFGIFATGASFTSSF